MNTVIKLPGLPKTPQNLHRSAMQLNTSRKSPNPLNLCVGALHGLAFKIKKPQEEGNPAVSYSRKYFYVLCIQAMVDSNYTFLSYSCRCVGSTHDSLAHAASSLRTYLQNKNLNDEFWIAGDKAYMCAEDLITPVPSFHASSEKDALNFFHSSLLMHVEQAFGMHTAKWGIFQKPLGFPVRKSSRIVAVAMKLHNFCLSKGSCRRD